MSTPDKRENKMHVVECRERHFERLNKEKNVIYGQGFDTFSFLETRTVFFSDAVIFPRYIIHAVFGYVWSKSSLFFLEL